MNNTPRLKISLFIPPLIWLFYKFFFGLFPFFSQYAHSTTEIYIYYIGFQIIYLFVLVFVILKWYQISSLKSFFVSWRNVGLLIFLFFTDVKINYWVAGHFSSSINQQVINNHLQFSLREGGLLLLLFLLSIVISGIVEELFFRVLLMETYFKGSPYYLDIFLSTILFALAHIQTDFSWMGLLGYLLISWPLPLIYRMTGSLYYPLLLHFSTNILPLVLYYMFHITLK